MFGITLLVFIGYRYILITTGKPKGQAHKREARTMENKARKELVRAADEVVRNIWDLETILAREGINYKELTDVSNKFREIILKALKEIEKDN